MESINQLPDSVCIAASAPRTLNQKLRATWTALAVAAVIGAGFGLTYLTYAHLVANGPAASMETIGELWEGPLP